MDSEFVMSVVRELLELAEANIGCHDDSKTAVIIGRARGYFMSARVLFDRFIESGGITDGSFVFPSWECLQSLGESKVLANCPT